MTCQDLFGFAGNLERASLNQANAIKKVSFLNTDVKLGSRRLYKGTL